MKTPLETLRHHVTGAIERGEKEAITEVKAPTIFEIYREELHKAVAAHPDEYLVFTTVDAVADKMIAAMKAGSYNKDGRAFKATAKRLGIKHTYIALNAAIKAAMA